MDAEGNGRFFGSLLRCHPRNCGGNGEKIRNRFMKDMSPLRQLFVLIFRRSAAQHFSRKRRPI